ncbi:DUF1788 domain-containing protein [Lacticaseibacillus kribbianus]|uniref:DUF1788 domain-containing protein n=1 Tax=Lacticaseibacillus kribbianus TaxID=2926292 RepID=UPI001CD5A534|nr:DUF1788 domain-containing protein [Lacticaseibacillus kribbianus]
MADLEKDLKRLREKIAEPDFQHNRGLSNEVGYYIFDYRPEDELRVREAVADIAGSATVATIGANVRVFNLYDMMLAVLDKYGYREKFAQFEQEQGTATLIREINNVLAMNEEHNLIVQQIAARVQAETAPTIIFLTGVGQVYPLLRAHKVLNTMNQVIDQMPVVMFYPGKYDGLHLSMFGSIQDDNYYRAFSLRRVWNDDED